MPLPIVIYAISIGLTLALASTIAYFWPNILNWLSNTISPWIKENIRIKEQEAFIELLSFFDNKITAVRRGVKGIVSKSILLIRSNFIKNQNTYNRKDEVYSKNKNGNVTVQTQIQEVPWDDIPNDVRAAFIRNNDTEKSINWLDESVLVNVNEA